jgi:2-dehydro-3-deoxyphosphogalactonate aldolase
VVPASVAILPVGGITPDKMAVWRAAGASGFGLGSALYRPGDEARTVGERARRFVAAWDAANGRFTA